MIAIESCIAIVSSASACSARSMSAARCRAALPPWLGGAGRATRRSESVCAAISSANPCHLLDGTDPHLPVADRARASRLDDGLDNLLGVIVSDHHFDASLRHKIDCVLGSSVDLRVALLPPPAPHLADP